MVVDKDFMVNFRWITPLALSVLALITTILIAVVNNMIAENRALRLEVAESRKFSIQYTDKMIELILKTGDNKK